MSEFMGNIRGRYEAKPEGFSPGGASLHSVMAGHGPDSEAFETHSDEKKLLEPERLSDDSLAFMFETTYLMRLTNFALNPKHLDVQYWECWKDLKNSFNKSS
jgi:homogentisate 1,2-dioxygenase